MLVDGSSGKEASVTFVGSVGFIGIELLRSCVSKMKTYSRKKQPTRYDFHGVLMDFNDICRLCLSEEGEKFQIFEDLELVPLHLRIMACLSIEVGSILE